MGKASVNVKLTNNVIVKTLKICSVFYRTVKLQEEMVSLSPGAVSARGLWDHIHEGNLT